MSSCRSSIPSGDKCKVGPSFLHQGWPMVVNLHRLTLRFFAIVDVLAGEKEPSEHIPMCGNESLEVSRVVTRRAIDISAHLEGRNGFVEHLFLPPSTPQLPYRASSLRFSSND